MKGGSAGNCLDIAELYFERAFARKPEAAFDTNARYLGALAENGKRR